MREETADRAGQVVSVLGQIFPTGEPIVAPLSVQLLSQGTEAAITATDYLGEFMFSGLAPGTYAVVVSAADWEVIIDAVVLEA